MFKLVNGGEKLPERATRYSCGFDVFANEDVTIGAGETVLVGLGVALSDVEIQGIIFSIMNKNELPIDARDYYLKDFLSRHYFELHPRSSLRAKGLGGGVGIIDIDFRNEIKMVISNPIELNDVGLIMAISLGENDEKLNELNTKFDSSYHIKKGDKIGQLILKRHEGYLMPSEYTKDEVRNGGFGSTGE